MAFVLPTFNLKCNIWHFLTAPPSPPVLPDVPCQLRAPSANNLAAYLPVGGVTVGMVVLLPPLTDIRDPYSGGAGSSRPIIEIPSGSGRFYGVVQVDDIGKGFPNEHRFASIVKLTSYPWVAPYP